MPILAEYALTPDVFDTTSYSCEEVCGLHLQSVKDVLLQEGVVRNLRDGEWARLFSGDHRPWHRRGKELIKKLAVQNRLIIYRPSSLTDPSCDADWCDEALHSHVTIPLNGIIVTENISGGYVGQPLVAPIHRLATTPWWISRGPSLRLGRTLPDYKVALDIVLRHANSIMFIDPHIDPMKRQYWDFTQLLQAAGNRTPSPLIEVHRVCYEGSGPSRRILSASDIEMAFRRELTGPMQTSGLTVNVFVWDDFHDRYLISNLAGISLPNGFDTTRAPNAFTTWTRLGCNDRDDIQREFDPASNHHSLRHRFRIS